MMALPPRWLRRILIAAGVVLAAVVLVTTMPALPNRFIAPAPFTAEEEGRSRSPARHIHELARGLDGGDALVIFPEGGTFTEARRLRRIARLHHDGLRQMATRAEGMRHVMAPHPGDSSRRSTRPRMRTWSFVAHTGMDRLVTVGDIWRELPMDKRIVMHAWQVPRSQVPAGRQERIDWLYRWWERIERWIRTHQDEASRGRRRPDPPGTRC